MLFCLIIANSIDYLIDLEREKEPLLVVMAATDEEGRVKPTRRSAVLRRIIALFAPTAQLLLFHRSLYTGVGGCGAVSGWFSHSLFSDYSKSRRHLMVLFAVNKIEKKSVSHSTIQIDAIPDCLK